MAKAFRAVCVFDSFKGSLTSLAAGEAAKRGILAAVPDADVTVLPVADGGEGTLDALTCRRPHERFELRVPAANHKAPITAAYAILERAGHRTAVLESAQTTSITQVTVDDTLPRNASSLGFGTLLADALSRGVDQIIVALGGSATTDGGTGVFQALGATLYDADRKLIPGETNPLWDFDQADFSGMPDLSGMKITILSDVTNPMTGPRGAAVTFGPQKGATPKQVAHLDAQNKKWVAALERHYSKVIDSIPGAGAAGGLAGASLALGGEIQPGFAWVAEELGIADEFEGAHLVLTGEGSLDEQSAYGKVPAGVAVLAKAAGATVVGLAGRITYPLGRMGGLLDAAFPIHSGPVSLKDALDPQRTAEGIQNTAEQVTRLVASRHK